MQLVLPLLCNDAASYVLSAWSMVSCGHIQEQLVMLFFYNDAASYVLSFMLLPCKMRPATRALKLNDEAARYALLLNHRVCILLHEPRWAVSVCVHTRERWRSSRCRSSTTMQPAACFMSAWRVASCGQCRSSL